MGLTNPTPLSLQPPYEDAITQIVNLYRCLISHQTYSHDEVTQGVENLEVLKTFFNSKRAQPPVSSNGSIDRDRERYQCLLCEAQKKRKAIILSFGSLKRHLSTMHEIYDSEFRCPAPGCPKTFYRRDRMREHLTLIHKKPDLKAADVEATRVRVPPPITCPVCPETIQSWDAFFRHIKNHCLVRSGSVTASNKGGRSRRGGNGGGNGGNGNGSSFAGPNSAQAQPPSYYGNQSSNQGNGQSGNSLHPGPFFGNFMNRTKNNARPGSIMHSVSDDQLNLSHRKGPNNVIDELSVDDLFNPTFDPNFHFTGGISRQPSQSRPPRNPGLPQVDQFPQKRKRPSKPEEPLNQKPSSPRKCTRCNHDLGKCRHCSHFTESVRGCHKCSDQPGVAMQAGLSSGMPVQTRQDPSSTLVTLDQSYLDPRPLGDFELSQYMPPQEPYYHSDGALQYHGTQTQRHSFDSAIETFIDDFSPTTSFIGVAMVVEDHKPLYDVQNEVQGSPEFDCDLKLLRSIGLGPLIVPFSPKSHIKQTKKSALIGPAPGSYTDLVFRNAGSKPTLQAPEPVPQCQCPCVTLPAVKYKAHASAQLSPYERVEMTFKMSPATRESSHPLRTRVHVLVKLFKLRSSITKSSAKKKQRNCSITSETNSEAGTESDTDMDHDLSPMSPSGSELAPVLLWTEDVQDWSFEFDLEWALSKLALWTSGVDADTCSKLFLSAPGHILDLISMYIMYKFKICWWMLGRDGLNLFLSI